MRTNSLRTLFFGEVFERFSYWGLQSILILYLVNQFHIQHSQAYLIFGTFTAFTFVFSVAGGMLADRWLGFRKAVLIGILLDAVGNIILISPGQSLVYLGLVFVILGTSVFGPSNSNLFGKLFSDAQSSQRESAFTIFYMGNNVGGFLGPIVFGFVAITYGWRDCFVLSAALLLIWLVIFIFQKKEFEKTEVTHKSNSVPGWLYFLFPFVLCLIWILIQHVEFSGLALGIFGLVTFALLIAAAFKSPKDERNSILMLLWMMVFGLLFFAFEFQVNSSLLIFANQYVNRKFYDWLIPTPSLAALEPFFIIVLTPIFAYFWQRNPSKRNEVFSSKIGVAFLLVSVGFLGFAGLAYEARLGGVVSMGWFLIGNAFLSAGEIYLMPYVIASITRLAPEHLKGTLMGALYLALAFSGYLAGLVASFTASTEAIHMQAMDYAHVYFVVAGLAGFVAIVWMASGFFLREAPVESMKTKV